MEWTCRFNAIIVREGDLYVARSEDLDITGHGATVESARADLIKAVELFLKTADPDEVTRRLRASRTQ